jgi:hypothetical protein
MAKKMKPGGRPAKRRPRVQDEERALLELAISTEKVCFFIQKAREFEVKDEVTEPDPGSNATDDGMIAYSRTTATIPSFKN